MSHGLENTSRQLGRLLGMPPNTIELLPEGVVDAFSTDPSSDGNPYRPFLLVDGNLGVPQKLLYKLYLHAIRTFFQSKSQLGSLAYSDMSRETVVLLRELTLVVLLANPAHQTTLNMRKRLIQHGHLTEDHELRVITALLTVRDCSKQAILWHHRRWLLSRLCSVMTGRHPCSDSLVSLLIPPELLQTEFSATAQACEVYPRNYYAWSHRYLCVEAVATAAAVLDHEHSEPYRKIMRDEFTFAQRWIESHVADYTSVQYLRSVYVLLCDNIVSFPCPPAPSSDLLPRPPDFGLVLAHARSLVEFYPEHESLWLYIRMLASLPHTNNDDTLLELQRFASQYTRDDKRGDRAHTSSRLPLLSTEDPIHSYASRLLEWLELS